MIKVLHRGKRGGSPGTLDPFLFRTSGFSQSSWLDYSTFDFPNKTSGRIQNVLYFSRRYIFVMPGSKSNATSLILIHSMAVGCKETQ